ncbi:52 kDa repressor of the inhibitor of the protein kinase-like [Metopolophium dirhodum]|uniref:52 kDa repressor of the inhibitor of the protein kinase-like n=1 Tax=Metopolophium dirhodum TaxID=44670 RepID=UPI00298FB8DB|nr:52 kDa repressor of the inhibitor of the protein kinase-like [Metopolophium dirhodum]
MLQKALKDSEFMISLIVIKVLFSYGLPLCKQLQKVQIDLKKTILIVENVIATLKCIRENNEIEFKIIYNNVKKMADDVGIELLEKRISSKQTHRANPNLQNHSTEQYYRVTVFLPYIDYFISQLTERFINHKSIFEGFDCIFKTQPLPLEINGREQFNKLVNIYSPVVDKFNSIAEFNMWKTKLFTDYIILSSGLQALEICDKEFYPNIYMLIKIFCTLPVSTTTPERSFSNLKRIKTYLRNSMNETRLNGLALLACHTETKITPDEVIDELSLKNRRLEFVL